MNDDLGLEVIEVSARFGGVVAVDRVSLKAPLGRCTGLIGPNGAGKTTLFNACFGTLASADGEVRLFGRSLTRLGPAARARAGLARTFQRMELFDSMTVAENVEMGAEASWVGSHVLRTLHRTRTASHAIATSRDEALELCGLVTLGDVLTRSLSTGQRRLVEFARALASPARVLLLDEPSSGLDNVETVRFGQILRQAVGERGVGVLLVEHDMRLVSSVCDTVNVLDFGRKIFEGTMVEAQQDRNVRAAYLGELDSAMGSFEMGETVDA